MTVHAQAPLRAIASVLVLLFVAGGCQRPAAKSATSLKVSERAPGMRQQVDDLVLSARRTVDLDHVDPAAYAAAIGSAPEVNFQFVRDRIAYETYPGVLRGPRGTLFEGPYFSGEQVGAEVSKMLANGFVEVSNPPWLPLVWP